MELDTRQERAQLASLEAQRDLAKVNYARMQQLVKQGVISRMEYDQATAQQKRRKPSGRNPGHDRAQDHPGAVLRACSASARSTSGSTCPPGSPVVPLQSLNPIYVNFRLAAAGAGPGASGPQCE